MSKPPDREAIIRVIANAQKFADTLPLAYKGARLSGLLARDPREPMRNQKILHENALYSALAQYFHDWAQQIDKRAHNVLPVKSTPQLVTPSDLDRLFQILITALDQAGQAGVLGAADELDSLFSFNMDWTGVNTQAATWARDWAGQLVKDIGGTTRERIGSAVENYINGAQTFGDLHQALQAMQGSAFSPERAAMIAQTEITRAFAVANSLAWKASGIVAGKRWNTNNDELVCPLCGGIDGNIVGIDESFGVDVFDEGMTEPPAHPNCRCWVTPISNMTNEDNG